MPDAPRIIAYTDGGCRGNPGPGAWAFVLIHPATREALEQAEAVPHTTNNRMELGAVVQALRAVRGEGHDILIRSDSRYTIQSCSEWMPGWKAHGWTRRGHELKNVDLLKELDALISRHRIRWQWVAGHSGDPGNDHVDLLLNQAMDALAAGAPSAHSQRIKWSGRL